MNQAEAVGLGGFESEEWEGWGAGLSLSFPEVEVKAGSPGLGRFGAWWKGGHGCLRARGLKARVSLTKGVTMAMKLFSGWRRVCVKLAPGPFLLLTVLIFDTYWSYRVLKCV